MSGSEGRPHTDTRPELLSAGGRLTHRRTEDHRPRVAEVEKAQRVRVRLQLAQDKRAAPALTTEWMLGCKAQRVWKRARHTTGDSLVAPVEHLAGEGTGVDCCGGAAADTVGNTEHASLIIEDESILAPLAHLRGVWDHRPTKHGVKPRDRDCSGEHGWR